MKRKVAWVALSCLMVLVLVAAACAPAPEEKAPAPAAPVAPTAPAAPAVKEAAPAVKEAAPAPGKETVTYTLTKLDGTKVTRTAEKPRYGGTLTVGPGSASEYFDEAFMPHWTVQQSISLANEELVGADWRRGLSGTKEYDFNHSAYLIPENSSGWLAESWAIEGDSTIVWKLRKGIRWENKPPVNGRELVADDVVFSLRRIYIDTTTSPMYAMAGADTRPLDIYARDKYTVVAEAPKGYTGFTWEYLAAWTRVIPPEVIAKYKDYTNWKNLVGTGPYILTDYVPQSSYTWQKNPNYWDTDPCLGADYPLPYIDTIRVVRVPDLSTEMAAIRTGKLDVAMTYFNVADFKSLQATVPWIKNSTEGENYRSGIYTSQRPIAWRLDNPDLPWAPMDDANALKVRRALYMAVDYEAWVRDIMFGAGSIKTFYVSDVGMFKHMRVEPEDMPKAFDGFDNRLLYLNEKIGIPFAEKQKMARQMLAEAGYPNGFTAELILTSGEVASGDWEIVVNFWEQVGVKLKLNVVAPAVKEQMRLHKTYKEMWVGSGATGHLYTMMHCRTANLYNFSVFSDPFMDETFLKVAQNYFNAKERDSYMREVDNKSHDKLYNFCAPLPRQWRVRAPWVKNFYNTGDMNMYDSSRQFVYAWLDPELKASTLAQR